MSLRCLDIQRGVTTRTNQRKRRLSIQFGQGSSMRSTFAILLSDIELRFALPLFHATSSITPFLCDSLPTSSLFSFSMLGPNGRGNHIRASSLHWQYDVPRPYNTATIAHVIVSFTRPTSSILDLILLVTPPPVPQARHLHNTFVSPSCGIAYASLVLIHSYQLSNSELPAFPLYSCFPLLRKFILRSVMHFSIATAPSRPPAMHACSITVPCIRPSFLLFHLACSSRVPSSPASATSPPVLPVPFTGDPSGA